MLYFPGTFYLSALLREEIDKVGQPISLTPPLESFRFNNRRHVLYNKKYPDGKAQTHICALPSRYKTTTN